MSYGHLYKCPKLMVMDFDMETALAWGVLRLLRREFRGERSAAARERAGEFGDDEVW